jgi:glycosyltransferase involved in cell wall biosynthesis
MGVDVVIRAAEKLKQENCPVCIHLIGEMSEKSLKRVQASPAADIFRVHGFTKESRAEFFRKIHAGLVPYPAYEDLSHIFPIKVLEHLSQGNPVIASRIPGLTATIRHEYNGLLVEPGNPDDLANAVIRLQKDRPLWEQLARNALESVKKFEAGVKNESIFCEIFRQKRMNNGA